MTDAIDREREPEQPQADPRPEPSAPQAQQPRWAAAGDRQGLLWLGLILVAVGLISLLGRLVPDAGVYIPLLVGVVLFAAFAVTRAYGFLVPAGIVTGVGVGIALQESGGQSGLFLVALGAGFASIWLIGSLLRLAEHHWWPLIPASILVTIGLVDLADEGGQLRDLLDLGWPLLLVLVGAIVLLRALSSRDTTQRG